MPFRVIPIPGTLAEERVEISEEEDAILRYSGKVSRLCMMTSLMNRAKIQHIAKIEKATEQILQQYREQIVHELED